MDTDKGVMCGIPKYFKYRNRNAYFRCPGDCVNDKIDWLASSTFEGKAKWIKSNMFTHSNVSATHENEEIPEEEVVLWILTRK